MIYLDNHATTVCDPNVVEAMLPYFTMAYGNPSSNHRFGEDAFLAVTEAKKEVAELLGATPEEIIFTSGATESNNLAILGSARAYRQAGGKKCRIVTSSIEHKSVLAPIKALASEGWEVCFLQPDRTGCINVKTAIELITEDTFLVSIQAANSEIGTIQPIRKLAEIANRVGSLFHTDATQAIGKENCKLFGDDIHFISLSAHKIYGPKGIGALYVKKEFTNSIAPLFYGGGQEQNLRPGTLPVPLIVGFGKACSLAKAYAEEERLRLCQLRDEFEKGLQVLIPKIIRNGNLEHRLVNNSNITFPGIEAEALLANLPELIASTGSACESGNIEPSRVLTQIGLNYDDAFATLRFGLGRFTTQQEIKRVIELIVNSYEQLL